MIFLKRYKKYSVLQPKRDEYANITSICNNTYGYRYTIENTRLIIEYEHYNLQFTIRTSTEGRYLRFIIENRGWLQHRQYRLETTFGECTKIRRGWITAIYDAVMLILDVTTPHLYKCVTDI